MWAPKFLPAPVGGRFTALNGPDRASTGRKGPPNALKCLKTTKRVQSALWPRANGIHHLAVRPAAIGARKVAFWGVRDPFGPIRSTSLVMKPRARLRAQESQTGPKPVETEVTLLTLIQLCKPNG